jgi:TetR/AcrR family transcriptional regulator
MGIEERKQREKEQRREEIIAAAEQVFTERGIALATMDEIAERAELGKSTLYLYYKTKEDLVMAVIIRGQQILIDRFNLLYSTGKSTMDMLANLVDAYYDFFKSNRNHFRMMFFFENPLLHKQVSEEMMKACEEKSNCIWGSVIEWIQKGIDEGLIQKNLNPRQLAIIMWSNANALMRQMDREDNYWAETMQVNLEESLKLSSSLLLEAMMTEEAKKKYPHYVI